jgi:hypothetical protein
LNLRLEVLTAEPVAAFLGKVKGINMVSSFLTFWYLSQELHGVTFQKINL